MNASSSVRVPILWRQPSIPIVIPEEQKVKAPCGLLIWDKRLERHLEYCTECKHELQRPTVVVEK